LQDYASPQTRQLGEKLIAQQVEEEVPEGRKTQVSEALERILGGERDIYY